MHHGMHHGRRLFTWNQLQQMNPFGHMQTLDLSSISAANTAVDATGTYLVTCQQPRLGCIRIQYFKNYDTVVTLISGVQGGLGVNIYITLAALYSFFVDTRPHVARGCASQLGLWKRDLRRPASSSRLDPTWRLGWVDKCRKMPLPRCWRITTRSGTPRHFRALERLTDGHLH